MFLPSEAKPLGATPAAVEMHGHEMILACLQVLQESAVKHGGLDDLQIFDSAGEQENLWFIENGSGGAIYALLPTDY